MATRARTEAGPFRCEVEPQRDTVRVRPVGELDAESVPVVDAELRELRIAGFARLVLDVSRVGFMDAAGLRLLETWHAAARAEGFDFDVVAQPPAMHPRFRVRRIAG